MAMCEPTWAAKPNNSPVNIVGVDVVRVEIVVVSGEQHPSVVVAQDVGVPVLAQEGKN